MLSSGPRSAHSGTSRRVSSPGLSSIAIRSEDREQHTLAPNPGTAGPGWLTPNGVHVVKRRAHVSKSSRLDATGRFASQESRPKEQLRVTQSSQLTSRHKADDLVLSNSAVNDDNSTHNSNTLSSSSSINACQHSREIGISNPVGCLGDSNAAKQPNTIESSPIMKQSNTTPHTAMHPTDLRSLTHPHVISFTSSNTILTYPASPLNHTDSQAMALLPSVPEHRHSDQRSTQSKEDTPTIGGPQHGKPPLTNKHQRSERADYSFLDGYTDVADGYSARKRVNPAIPTADYLNGQFQEHTLDDLPLRLRNKKMKPTDCLLYAASLLSKNDDSVPIESEPTSRRCCFLSTTTPSASIANTAKVISTEDVTEPREYDVLCGRGGFINKHTGNVVYRKVVEHNKPFYQSVHKRHRILVSESIVQSILKFGGRFLITGAKGKAWMEIGYKKAVQKTSQALRERTPAQEGDDEDEDDNDIVMESRLNGTK